MQFKSLKGLILATSAIAAVTFTATDVRAATSASMGVSVESIDAVDVTKLNDMNFGKWLLNYSAESIVLTLNPLTNAVSVNSLTTSSAQQLASTSRGGRLAVDIPAGINNYTLDMTVAAPSAFTDTAAYTLTSISYATATEAVATVTADGVATHPVTVLTGGTPETVYFGGVLTVGAQPTTNVLDNGASFTVNFAY